MGYMWDFFCFLESVYSKELQKVFSQLPILRELFF